MPETLRNEQRRAAKPHWCSLCGGTIRKGDHHDVTTTADDGRIYDWRICRHCSTGGVFWLAYDWAGRPDEGIGEDTVVEWSAEAVWSTDGRERTSARAVLARRYGGEGE